MRRSDQKLLVSQGPQVKSRLTMALALRRLLADIEVGKIDVVIVYTAQVVVPYSSVAYSSLSLRAAIAPHRHTKYRRRSALISGRGLET